MCKNIIDLDGEFNMMYSFRVKNVHLCTAGVKGLINKEGVKGL